MSIATSAPSRSTYIVRLAIALIVGVGIGFIGLMMLGIIAVGIALSGPDYQPTIQDHLIIWPLVFASIGLPIFSWVRLGRWVAKARPGTD